MTTADLLWRAAHGPLTIADLPLDVRGVRIELLDGSLYVTPLGDYEHQGLVADCTVMIRPLLPPGLRVLSGVKVIVGEQTLVEPDVAVVDPSFVTHAGLGIAPDGVRFVLEVTSPSTRRRDLTERRELYREWGIPYLVIDRSTQPFTRHAEGELPTYTRVVLDEGPGRAASG